MSFDTLLAVLARFAPLVVTIVVTVAILMAVSKTLRRHWEGNADAQFRFQLIMLTLTFVAVIVIVIALPVNETLRGQLLSLLGILLSAAIALSSTTFVGNIMAGIMLKAVKSARPGDFITVAELTGRITKMALLHTEIQTEFRDLVTVPNLYLVTQPIKIVRASGSVISAEVTLSYDVPRTDVADVLCRAAKESGLKDPFVHVRELGDYSILYRIAGLLEDVESLISARSRLREAMLDELHAAKIEIVSPAFMNSRVYSDDTEFIPEPSRSKKATVQAQAEEIIFDKAAEVAAVEDLKKKVEGIDDEIALLTEESSPGNEKTIARLEKKKSNLLERVASEEDKILEAEKAEND